MPSPPQGAHEPPGCPIRDRDDSYARAATRHLPATHRPAARWPRAARVQVIGMHRWTGRSLRALPVAGLLAVGLAVSLAAPVAAQSSGTWTKTGSMTTPRLEQTATLLANGQVLVVG